MTRAFARGIYGRGRVEPPLRGKPVKDVARNGQLATTVARGQLSDFTNRLIAGRRRMLGAWEAHPLDSYGNGVGFAGNTWSETVRLRVNTSYQMTRVIAVLVLGPSTSASQLSLPEVRIGHRAPDSGELYSYYRSIAVGKRKTAGIAPDDYTVHTVVMDPASNTGTREIIPDSVYDVVVEARGLVRVISVSLFEEQGRLHVDNPYDVEGSTACSLTTPSAGVARLYDPNVLFGEHLIGAQLAISGTTSADGLYWIRAIINEYTVEFEASFVAQDFVAGSRYRIRSVDTGPGVVGSEIKADGLDRLTSIPYQIHKRGGGAIIPQFSQILTPISRTSSTYANIHDQSQLAWSSLAPGHPVYPLNRGTYEEPREHVVMWVDGKLDTTNVLLIGQVDFRVFGRTIGTVFVRSRNNSFGTLFTATGWLDTTHEQDIVQVLIAGTGSVQIKIYGYGMYPHED